MNNYAQGKMEYLRTKVLTASPEELHLMLLDGAIRFAEEGKAALQEGDLEKAHNALVRTQNIMLEISSGLDHQAQPDLCSKLSSLYNFIYRRLVEGNMKRDIPAIDDALRILDHQRETWVMLMDKMVKEQQETYDQSAAAIEAENIRAQQNQDQFQVQPGFSLSLSV
jgi:flagellar protein FliS